MNLAQRLVLICSFLLVLVMGLFPPWKRVYDFSREESMYYVAPHPEKAAGYHLILRDQATGTVYETSMRIDTTRLGVQFVVVVVLTALLYLIVKPRKRSNS